MGAERYAQGVKVPFSRWIIVLGGLAAAAGAVGVGLWFLSPSVNKEYSFALLTIAMTAAVLSALQLVRGEVHQRSTSQLLAQVASLLRIEAALVLGFATGEEGEPAKEIDVTPNWAERDQPAVKVRTVRLVTSKEPESDLVLLQFRVSNTRGRDPADNVFVRMMLSEDCEAYKESEFQTLPNIPPTGRSRWGPSVIGRDRRDVRFGFDSLSNGVWATTDRIWLRLPAHAKGAVSISYTLSAARIPSVAGRLTINVQ